MSQIISRDGFVAKAPRFMETEILEMNIHTDPSTLVEQFGAWKMIVIPFAASTDGRGFSLAAQLRALGYKGHLRARGHVLVDQFRAALKSGFDDIEISDDQAKRNPENQWCTVSMGRGYLSEIFPNKTTSKTK